MSFCPFHNHSEYSALDGLSTTREIAERCVELGYPAVGLSDHGTVAGHLDFGRTLPKYDVKPIFACEMYHGVNPSIKGNKRDQAHLLLGAINDQGLKNLWRLVDEAAENFHHVPRATWELLEKYSEGLFATSACIQSLVGRELLDTGGLDALNRYLEIFGDNFFIELHTYPGEDQEWINHRLVEAAETKGLPMTVATDAHFASPDQYDIHDAYMAIQMRESIHLDPEDRKMWHPKALYIQSVEEIKQNLDYLPGDVVDEAIKTNVEVAEGISADLPSVKRHLPVFIPKESEFVENSTENAALIFIDLVEKGIRDRYGPNPEREVWDRAEQEMEVFISAGLEHYFLQTWEMCEYCKREGIQLGPGRGSAAGAIVAYALGITDIDPLHYGLVFERFYNPGREKGFPDIDNDLPKGDRPKVREYLAKRWGKENVLSIGNHVRMKPLGACETTWIGCGVTYGEKEKVKGIIKKVPDLEILGADSIGWSSKYDPGKTIYVMEPTEESNHDIGDQLHNWVATLPVDRQPIVERWFEILEVITSRVRHYGIHASGTVVSDVDLRDELPRRWVPDQKTFVTQFPMADVDARKFIKQDLLVIRNLDTLQEWEKMYGPVEWHGLERQNHPEEMWEMLDNGLSLGIFQIEGGYAHRLCKEFKPRSVEDLAIIGALNRPGPIRSGAVDPFIRRRKGEEEVTYPHESLVEILEPTYGFFLYQEQVIAFFTKLGYSLSDADAVRKILGKKKPEQMKELYLGRGEWFGKGFIDVGFEQLGEEAGDRIWDSIVDFAKYSFNKSHAIAYATLGFRTLYAKYKDPAMFIVALLQTNPEGAPGYVAEGNRMGIKVIAPEIDRSDVDVQTVDGDIIFGFANIDGIGKTTAKYLLQLREKYDLTSPEKLYEAVEAEQKEWEDGGDKRTARSPRQRFRKNLYNVLYEAGCWDTHEARALSLRDRQKLEKQYLKVILTDDSEETFARNHTELDRCDEYAALDNGAASLKLPGVITNITERHTKKDRKKMAVVTIEYGGDEAEFVVFPQQWVSYQFLWKERTTGVFGLKKSDRGLHFSEGRKLT